MSVIVNIQYRGRTAARVLQEITDQQVDIYNAPPFKRFLAENENAQLWGIFDWDDWFRPYIEIPLYRRRWESGRVPINIYIYFI